MRTLDRAEEEPVEPGPSAPVESNISEHDTTQFLFAEIRFADETTEDSLEEVLDEDLNVDEDRNVEVVNDCSDLEIVDEDVVEEVVDEGPRDLKDEGVRDVLEEVVEEKQNPPNQPLPLRRSPRKKKSNIQSKKLVCRVQRKVATSKRVKRSTKQPSQTEAGPSNAI